MKKFFIAAVLCLAAIGAQAQDYNWAIGVRGGGNSSGVTIKHILSDYNAVEVTFDYWYPKQVSEGKRMIRTEAIHALYEWNTPIFTNGFILYYGAGGHIGSMSMQKTSEKNGTENYGRLGLGLDGVVGIEYKLYDLPLAFSLDYRPYFNVFGFIPFFSNVSLGVKLAF